MQPLSCHGISLTFARELSTHKGALSDWKAEVPTCSFGQRHQSAIYQNPYGVPAARAAQSLLVSRESNTKYCEEVECAFGGKCDTDSEEIPYTRIGLRPGIGPHLRERDALVRLGVF